MVSRLVTWIPGTVLACSATIASAQPSRPKENGDLLLRINAAVTVAPAESASTVWVIGNDAYVQGTVRQQLIVMNGTAHISGTVEGGVAVFNGALDLAPTARVGRDVYLYRSTMARASGSSIGGKIETSRGPAFGQWFTLGIWFSTTLVIVAFGLLVAATAGKALLRGADVLSQQPGAAVVTSLVTWIGAPILIAVSFATIVGIPLGVAILVFLLPALGFFGLVVSGTAIGRALLGGSSLAKAGARPYRAVALGLVVLQLVGFVPVVGGLVVLVAGAVGAGALVYRGWTEWRGPRPAALVPAPAV